MKVGLFFCEGLSVGTEGWTKVHGPGERDSFSF